jgi:hypothetical protein
VSRMRGQGRPPSRTSLGPARLLKVHGDRTCTGHRFQLTAAMPAAPRKKRSGSGNEGPDDAVKRGQARRKSSVVLVPAADSRPRIEAGSSWLCHGHGVAEACRCKCSSLPSKSRPSSDAPRLGLRCHDSAPAGSSWMYFVRSTRTAGSVPKIKQTNQVTNLRYLPPLLTCCRLRESL